MGDPPSTAAPVVPAAPVLARWRTLATERLRLPGVMWEVPACTGLVEAIVAGIDLDPAARRYAGHRARAGFTFDETVLDVATLASVEPRAAQALDRLVIGVTLAETFRATDPSAWAEPLTELPGSGYLALRIRESQRAAHHLGMPVASALRLVCVRLPPAASIAEATLAALTTAEALRCTFDRGETVAAVSMRVFAVLTAQANPETSIDGLVPGSVVWLEPIPEAEATVGPLLDDLACQ